MIEHKDTIEHCYTEERDESHASRDAKGQSPHPQCHDATDERQRNRGKNNQRPCDTSEGKEEQEEDEYQCNRNNYEERLNGVLKIFELSSILEIIARRKRDMFVQRLTYLLHHLSDISVSHIHTDDHPAFGSVTIDLQRSVVERDVSHLTHRNLLSVACPHIESVEVEVAHFLLIQSEHEVKASLVLKHHACRLSGISGAHDVVELLDVYPIAGYLRAVIMDDELRQPHRLLHDNI